MVTQSLEIFKCGLKWGWKMGFTISYNGKRLVIKKNKWSRAHKKLLSLIFGNTRLIILNPFWSKKHWLGNTWIDRRVSISRFLLRSICYRKKRRNAKKNFVKLWWHRKWPKDRKDAESAKTYNNPLSASFRPFGVFQSETKFFWGLAAMRHLFGRKQPR